MSGSRTLPLENGCVRPGTRTSHRTLRTENEGVVLLLESRLFGLGDAWVNMVPAGAGVTQALLHSHRVGHFSYQESRYTDSSSGGFRSRSRGPRVYG